MADMREEVSRAIARICNEKGQELASKYEAQAPPIPWQAFEREAKAAIEAMEIPTDEMVEAGLDDPKASYCDRCMQSGHVRNSGYPAIIWRAMWRRAMEGKDD